MTNPRVMIRWLVAAAALAVAEFWSWSDERDTAATALGLLRLIVMVFGVYLLLVVIAGGAARCLRLARTTAVVDRVTLPFVRTLFGSLALFGVIGSPPSPNVPSHDTMVELPSDPSGQGTATLHLLPEPPTSTSTTAPVPTSAPTAPAPPADAIAETPDIATSPSDSTWIVEHGESFWSIAQSHLDDVHGRHADESEVVRYWRELIDANRARLVSNDPDLLFTGQEIELPAVAIG